MTTLVYNNITKLIGADTRVNFDNYAGYCTKIVFPKKNVILATAGDSGACEWLRYKLSVAEKIHDLYNIEPDKHPEFESLECFIWWNGPYCVDEDLCPMPIETDYWHGGSGGAYAVAYMHIGWPIEKAIEGATKLDPNSGPPIHVVDCSAAHKKVKVYSGGATVHIPSIQIPTNITPPQTVTTTYPTAPGHKIVNDLKRPKG